MLEDNERTDCPENEQNWEILQKIFQRRALPSNILANRKGDLFIIFIINATINF